VIRIAIISDGHYGGQWEDPDRWSSEGDETPCDTRYEMLVNWVNDEILYNGLDFVVVNGDNWHDEPNNTIPSGYPGAGTSYRGRVKYWLDQINCPYYVTHGNHDRDSFSAFNSHFGHPVNHHFEYGGYGFILANTGSENGADEGWGTGYLLPDAQFIQDTSASYIDNEKPVIIFSHVDWTSTRYNGGGLYSGDFGDNAGLHNYVRSNPHILSVHWGHRHAHTVALDYGGQNYLMTGHFSHRTDGQDSYGYRIIELTDRSE